MALFARGLIAAATLAVAVAQAPATAQALDRVHVGAFTLSADPTRLRVGDTLRLTMHVHVDEQVAQLDNVTLPNLTGFDVMGDERRCSSSGRGTDCSETVTMSPTVDGNHTLGPVTLDAVDPRTKRPARYATNTVQITVLPNPQGPTAAPSTPDVQDVRPNPLFDIGRTILIVALAAMFVLAVLWWLGRAQTRFSRRPAPPQPSQPVPAPPPQPAPPPPDADAPLRDAIAVLRADPSRAHVLAVRSLLRERARARETETLGDLAARGVRRDDPKLYDALAAVERAAFGDDAAVAPAAGEALGRLEALAGNPQPHGDDTTQ